MYISPSQVLHIYELNFFQVDVFAYPNTLLIKRRKMMLKKIIIGVLLVSVIGAAGAALAYNATHKEAEVAATGINPLAQAQSSTGVENIAQGQAQAQEQLAVPAQAGPVAQGMEGEAWESMGNITALDDFGFDFTTTSGETVYIELGPPDYWQSQNIDLAEGQLVTISGSINEGIIHAATVTTVEGQVLTLRTDAGQPMWSGGVQNSNGQNGQSTGSADGSHTPDPKAQVDEWVTIEGTLMAFQGGNMTMSTADGSIISFQTGQPRFFAEQGVTFQVGDQISVVGFYEGDQFMAGDITQLSTGLRVMLRDPNGRPLWAGPGNSNGNGGNGGNGNGGGRQGQGEPQG